MNVAGVVAMPVIQPMPHAPSPVTMTPASQGLTGPGSSTAAGSGGGFANAVGNIVDSLSQVQGNATRLEAQSAAGQGNLVNTMIAASEASLDTQVTTTLLNKGLAAYTSIANMTF